MSRGIPWAGVAPIRYQNLFHMIHENPRARTEVGTSNCKAEKRQRTAWGGLRHVAISHSHNECYVLESTEPYPLCGWHPARDNLNLAFTVLYAYSFGPYKYTIHYKGGRKTKIVRTHNGTKNGQKYCGA